ncbi:MAG: aminotransferase class V-fold PLP-dependent enzyme [Polyangiaceae bacterium]
MTIERREGGRAGVSDGPPSQSSTREIEAPRLVPDAKELRPRFGSWDLWSGLVPLVFMNHAGISAPSVVVRKAITGMLNDYGKRGAAAYPSWAAQRARLKTKLATLLNAQPADFALTQNTTSGVIAIATCFDWKPGDRVVVFEGEFPANVTPWLRAAATFGLEAVRLDARQYLVDRGGALEALKTVLAAGRVRMVAVSAVEFQTGLRMPLAEMAAAAHAHGARLFVDAVQACGVVPIDVGAMGIDYLASGAHKWLMGVEGAGFVYASPEAVGDLVPRLAGWLSHVDPVRFLFDGPGLIDYDKPFKSTIDFLEGGNVSASSFVGLEASLDLLLELGIENIYNHVLAIGDALEAAAVERGMRSLRAAEREGRSGMVCVLPPESIDVVAFYRELTNQGIACAVPDGVVRFSPHWPNAVDESEQVALAIEQALAACRGSAG